jgi:hypothetical protein
MLQKLRLRPNKNQKKTTITYKETTANYKPTVPICNPGKLHIYPAKSRNQQKNIQRTIR